MRVGMRWPLYSHSPSDGAVSVTVWVCRSGAAPIRAGARAEQSRRERVIGRLRKNVGGAHYTVVLRRRKAEDHPRP